MEGSVIHEVSRKLKVVLRRLYRRLSGKQFLILGAIIVGLWAGLAAVILKLSVHYLQDKLVYLGQRYFWIYLAAPAIGILLTIIFVRLFLNGTLIKGTSHVLLAIARKSSMLEKRETYSHVVTSALTVGLGGSAGLESPIVQTGAAIGSIFSSLFPVGYRDRTLLLACGAAAGIATAFNAPIAGVLFALEVLLVDVNISAFIPLLMAGATGALCSRIILNEEILLSFRSIAPFNYNNVPYYILLGGICGLVSVYYVKTTLSTERIFKRVFSSTWSRLAAGGVVLGILILFFPALFGEGYTSIKDLALSQPDWLFVGSPWSTWISSSGWILGVAILVLSLIKVFAVTFTLGAGGNGGNFAPSLLVGAGLGFSVTYMANLTGMVHLPVSNFCLVAMAGVLTGVFHAPLTGIFLIAEITGGYELIIPLMIVSAISTGVSRYLGPYSLDESRLKQDEHLSGLSKDSHVLPELSLGALLEKDFVAVPQHATMRTLIEAVAQSKRNIFPVLNEQGGLVGIISLEHIREIMFDQSRYDNTLVDSIMQPPAVVAEWMEPMEIIMERFDKSGVWNIPVLKQGIYVGFISKSRVLTAYRDKLNKE